MPWITISAPRSELDATSLPDHVATEAAAALGLTADDIIVLHHATASTWGHGAVVTVHGRPREPDREADLLDRLRRVVAADLNLAGEVVHVVRAAS